MAQPHNGQNIDAAFFSPVTCRCGSEWFDVIQRHRVEYNRLDSSQVRAMPGNGYKCSECGEVLKLMDRIAQIRKSIIE